MVSLTVCLYIVFPVLVIIIRISVLVKSGENVQFNLKKCSWILRKRIKLINKTKFINRIPFRASNIVNDKVFQQLGGDFSNCLQVWRGEKYTEVCILYVAIGIVRRLAIVKQKCIFPPRYVDIAFWRMKLISYIFKERQKL